MGSRRVQSPVSLRLSALETMWDFIRSVNQPFPFLTPTWVLGIDISSYVAAKGCLDPWVGIHLVKGVLGLKLLLSFDVFWSTRA